MKQKRCELRIEVFQGDSQKQREQWKVNAKTPYSFPAGKEILFSFKIAWV